MLLIRATQRLKLNAILKHFKSGLSCDASSLSCGFISIYIYFLEVELGVIRDVAIEDRADHLAGRAPIGHKGNDERLTAVGSRGDRILVGAQICKVQIFKLIISSDCFFDWCLRLKVSERSTACNTGIYRSLE